MLIVFAGIALLAAAGSFFVTESADKSTEKEPPSWPVLGIGVFAAAIGLGIVLKALGKESSGALMPYVLGASGVLLVGILERFRRPNLSLGIGVATAVAAVAGAQSVVAVQALLAGAAVAALVVGSPLAMVTAFGSGMILCLDRFNQASDTAPASTLGVMLGALLAVLCLLQGLAKKAKSVPDVAVAVFVTGALGAGALLALRSAGESEIGKLFFLPIIAGLAVHWLMNEKDAPRSLSTNLVVGLIWLGGATLAFAVSKSTGLALWLILGVGVPLALGNLDAVGSAAPFAALTWYRLVQSDLTSGSDLSRFYILTGLAAGIGLVAAGWEWRGRVSGVPGAVGGALWALLAGGAAVLGGIVFGPRGFVGVLEGSGLGSMLGGTHKRPLTAALLSATMATIGALCLPSLQDASFGRDEKTKLFISSAAAILVVAGVLFALQIEKKKETTR